MLMNGRKIYLLDLATQQLTKLSWANEKPLDFYVSPNRKFMAISNVRLDSEGFIIAKELIIADASGQRLKSIPWKDEWRNLLGWMDNQYIKLNVNPDLEEETSFWKFDPFLEDQQGIMFDNIAPGWDKYINTSAPSGLWPGFSSLHLDPAYTMSLYPQNIEGDSVRFTYVLWSITDQQLVLNLDTIVNMDNFFHYYPLPDWSPDNSKFALGGLVWHLDRGFESELFVITRDGQVKQMTRLTELDHEIICTFPSWSPDGRYIAMYLVPDGVGKSRLAVLDTETLQLTDYCVVSNVQGASIPKPPAPLWSPDSKQLLLLDSPEPKSNRVIWVNLEQGLAAQVAENIDLAQWYFSGGMWGWMSSTTE